MSSSLDLNLWGAFKYLAPEGYNKDAFHLKDGTFSPYRSACCSYSEGLSVTAGILGFVDVVLGVILGIMFVYQVVTGEHADWVPFFFVLCVATIPSAIVFHAVYIASKSDTAWFVWNEAAITAGEKSIQNVKSSKQYVTRKEVYYGLAACLVLLAAIRKEFDELVDTTRNSKFTACSMSVESAYNHVYETFRYTQSYASNKLRENSQVEWLTPVLEKAVRATDLANSLIELSTRSSLTSAQLIGSAHIDILLNDVEAARLKLEALDEVSASTMLERGSFNSN